MLKAINSSLYEPCSFLGWYPPLVSPNQIRGTWTEPAFFAIWLSFAVPFLVSFFFEDGVLSRKKAGIVLVFFTTLFSIWFMTYARTSVVLMAALVGLYFLFAILYRTRENWRVVGVLVVTILSGFLIVSTCGPQERGQRVHNQTETSVPARLEKSISDSVLFENTVKSSVDAKSRSNPSRLQDFQFKFKVFKDYPIAGAGDTLASVAQIRKMLESPDILTGESRLRLAVTNTKGVFESGVGGTPFTIAGMLANRGLLGFVVVFFPIFVLGIRLFLVILKLRNVYQQIGISLLVSGSCVFLSVFTCGIKFYDFWCVAGLDLSLILFVKNGHEFPDISN